MAFTTFTDLLRRAAQHRPEWPFLRTLEDAGGWTYGEAESAVQRMAGLFRDLGVSRGDRVALFASTGPDYLLACFGVWRLGAISTHINIKQAEDLTYFVHNSTPRLLLYTADMAPAIQRDREFLHGVTNLVGLTSGDPGLGALDWGSHWRRAPAFDGDSARASDPAHLSYTSGSSGRPKGALIPHGSTVRAAHGIAERLGLDDSDVALSPTSPASSFGLVGNWLPMLHRRGTVVLTADWNASHGWLAMEEQGISYCSGNPFLFAELLAECQRRGRAPANLRLLVSGGAPLPVQQKHTFANSFGITLAESYGQSEIGGFVALGRGAIEPPQRRATIGRALPDKEVRIVDEEGREQSAGEPGEMVLRGGFMVGYWARPDKTAEVIRAGWLHTGDMGVMDSAGYVTMLGRWSERIVHYGRVIYPRPMEEVLDAHPAVGYAAVIGAPDPAAGENPKAIVTLNPGYDLTPETLLAYCQDHLGDEPAPIEAEIIPEMPMTATGKIGRASLQKREQERAQGRSNHA